MEIEVLANGVYITDMSWYYVEIWTFGYYLTFGLGESVVLQLLEILMGGYSEI